MGKDHNEILSVDCRPLTDVGNSIGQTLDKKALRELGVVDADGDVLEDISARQIIYTNGHIDIEIDVPDDLDVTVTGDD